MYEPVLICEDARNMFERGLEVTYGSDILNESPLLIRVLIMRLALYCDLLPSSPSAKGKFEGLRRVILSLRHIDIELYSSSWALTKELVLTNLSRGKDWYQAFKQPGASHTCYRWVWNSVIGLAEEGVGLASIIQWIVFDEKLNLRSLDLSTEAVLAYKEEEAKIKSSDYTVPVDLQQVYDEWCNRIDLQGLFFYPRHGNGATAELSRRKATAGEKERHLTLTPSISRWLHIRDISNIDPTWFFTNQSDDRDDLRTARLQLVPKSMVKNRTISMEPSTLQYLQQDIWRVMDRFFKQNLSDHVDLHDQSISGQMCLAGSISGAYATIDLSSASDSVSLDLVQSAFRQHGDMLYGLLTTRSRFVKLPNGELLSLSKYAGMGNGTTFPIETFIFAGMCETAARRTFGNRHDSCYRVYGDDIIIETECVGELIGLLTQLHFRVNTSKSYWSTTGHIFREACGMWAVDGLDITPLRLSRRLYWNDGSSPSEALGWVALLNASLRYGFLTLRRAINTLLNKQAWYSQLLRVRYSDEEKPWISRPAPYVLTFDTNATQWRVKQRFNKKLWRPEAQCLCVKSQRTSDESYSEENFRIWQRETLLSESDPDDSLEDREWEHTGSLPLRWGRTWVSYY